MMNNVRVLFKRSVFREITGEEVLAAAQAIHWSSDMAKEMEAEAAVSAALASAKLVDSGPAEPAKPEKKARK